MFLLFSSSSSSSSFLGVEEFLGRFSPRGRCCCFLVPVTSMSVSASVVTVCCLIVLFRGSCLSSSLTRLRRSHAWHRRFVVGFSKVQNEQIQTATAGEAVLVFDNGSGGSTIVGVSLVSPPLSLSLKCRLALAVWRFVGCCRERRHDSETTNEPKRGSRKE